MPDLFLLLTPILLLIVVGLLVFVGCGRIGFDPPAPPKGLTAVGRCDVRVDVSWDPVQGAIRYDLIRTDKGNNPIYSGSDPWYADPDVSNLSTYQPNPCYRVRVIGPGTSDYSDPVCAIPPPAQPFVSGPQGSLILQSNLTTFMGMKIELGANPATILEVCALGRFLAPGNGTNPDPTKTSHLIRIVDAVRDVDMASVTVSTVPGVSGFFFDPSSNFLYAILSPSVILKADPVNPLGDFYVVSEEIDTSADANPELWGDGTTPVTSTVDGFVMGSVFGNTGAWNVQRAGSFCFGPVNFRYRITVIIY
jgi:hypothetical protein